MKLNIKAHILMQISFNVVRIAIRKNLFSLYGYHFQCVTTTDIT
jgi:hypothetical protein